MAFISEIHYRNNIAKKTGVSEYTEVTLSPAEFARASEFTVSTYDQNGNVVEVFTLSDLSPVLDPNTGHYVYQIPTLLSGNGNGNTDTEPSAVALMDNAQLLSFYDIGSGPSLITAVDGPAAGSTSTNIAATSKQSIQFDAYGNRVDGNLTQGSSVICLTGGTLIETPDGPRLIEELAVDDLVTTFDSGNQPVRMIYKRTLRGESYRRNRKLWPVCIQAGALGFGLPRRNLRVSPQHRMLYQHIRIPLLFGEDAVFVRAKSLAASFEEVYVDCGLDEITYFHLVFDRHEVIYAEGAPTESFHPGPQGIAALDAEARTELFAIFPELEANMNGVEAAYPTLRSWELMAMVG